MSAKYITLWRQVFEATTGAKVLFTLEFKGGVRAVYWHRRKLQTFFVRKYG